MNPEYTAGRMAGHVQSTLHRILIACHHLIQKQQNTKAAAFPLWDSETFSVIRLMRSLVKGLAWRTYVDILID